VAEAARRVIARSGLDNTRLRDIAEEAGFTTGVLTHHFPDKRSVIFATFAAAYGQWLEEAQRTFAAASDGPELLGALLARAVPSTQSEQRDYRLWIEMLAYACSDQEFAVEVMHVDTLTWERELAMALTRLQKAGLLHENLDVVAEARIMNRLIDGLCIRAWLNDGWADARRHFVIHLAALGVPDPVARTLLSGP
jgi:AcrR family transcriptional regulator